MEKAMKNFFLFLSKNRTATKLARKYGLKFGAQRFVSGDTLSSAIDVTKRLNQQNIMTTLDHLGEFISSEAEAAESTQYCIETLQAIFDHKVNANLSVKLTQLGLDLSEELCLDNMRNILQKAKETDNFVRIDMEDYARNEKTIAIFETLKKEFGKHVGLVIQAYLYKSLDDIQSLHHYQPNLRLCKGAYKESSDVAFPDKKDVDQNYLTLVQTHLKNGHYVGIATHDPNMINQLIDFITEHHIPHMQFEFQMLYGIQTELLEELAKKGYRTRTYIPYGIDWYGYFMRRLAERPANVWFVLKNIKKS